MRGRRCGRIYRERRGCGCLATSIKRLKVTRPVIRQITRSSRIKGSTKYFCSSLCWRPLCGALAIPIPDPSSFPPCLVRSVDARTSPRSFPPSPFVGFVKLINRVWCCDDFCDSRDFCDSGWDESSFRQRCDSRHRIATRQRVLRFDV